MSNIALLAAPRNDDSLCFFFLSFLNFFFFNFEINDIYLLYLNKRISLF